MTNINIWQFALTIREMLLTFSTSAYNMLFTPLNEITSIAANWTIFGVNVAQWFTLSTYLRLFGIGNFTIFEVLSGSALTVIIGLVLVKKLIPIA